MTVQTKDPEKNVFASLIHSYLYKFLYRRFSLQGVFYHLSRCLVVLHKRQVAILYCLSRKLKETKPYIILTIVVPLSLTLTISKYETLLLVHTHTHTHTHMTYTYDIHEVEFKEYVYVLYTNIDQKLIHYTGY